MDVQTVDADGDEEWIDTNNDGKKDKPIEQVKNNRLIFIKILHMSMFISVFLVFVHENAR